MSAGEMTPTVVVGQRWRQRSTGHEYVVTKVGQRKATFERRTPAFDEKATVWIDRLVKDSDWRQVEALEIEYEMAEDQAKNAIQCLITEWGIDGLILLESVEKWIGEAA